MVEYFGGNKNMRIIIIILVCLIIFGCSGTVTLPTKPTETITYFKDDRTNLCFAQLGSNSKDLYTITSISNVPCEKVEQYLIK